VYSALAGCTPERGVIKRSKCKSQKSKPQIKPKKRSDWRSHKKQKKGMTEDKKSQKMVEK
jgi:hypothetical protein